MGTDRKTLKPKVPEIIPARDPKQCVRVRVSMSVSQDAVPVTKSARRGSQSAVPATKSAHRGSPSALPATKSALRGSPSAVPARKSALQGSPSAAPATKSANKPHVQKSRFTAPVTDSEIVDDHHHVESAVPATKNCISKYNSSEPLHLSRKVDFGAPKHEVSLAAATKSNHHVRKCARHHNESAVALEAPAGGRQIL